MSNEDSSDEEVSDNDDVVDVEDLVIRSVKKESLEEKEMITPPLRQILTKQGYKLIGTHSGVKLCRWTKVIALWYLYFSVITLYLTVLIFIFF